jgi:hypothetical protein
MDGRKERRMDVTPMAGAGGKAMRGAFHCERSSLRTSGDGGDKYVIYVLSGMGATFWRRGWGLSYTSSSS